GPPEAGGGRAVSESPERVSRRSVAARRTRARSDRRRVRSSLASKKTRHPCFASLIVDAGAAHGNPESGRGLLDRQTVGEDECQNLSLPSRQRSKRATDEDPAFDGRGRWFGRRRLAKRPVVLAGERKKAAPERAPPVLGRRAA